MKFELNIQEKNKIEILVDIPFGKVYLSDLDKKVQQNEQKGSTCFYKSLNSYGLRRKFGKAFPENHPERAIELKISQYKKQSAKAARAISFLKELISSVKSQPDFALVKMNDRQFVSQLLKKYAAISSDGESIIKLINSFLDQTDHEVLDEFLKAYNIEQEINYKINFLQSLNCNVEELLKDYLEKNKINSRLSDIYLLRGRYSTFLGVLVETEIIKLYKLHISSWIQSDGFLSLKNELEKNGAIYAGGLFGNGFCAKPAFKLNNKFGKWDVYGWEKNVETVKQGATHAIVIIGLQKINNKEYVLFLDPNYPITLQGPNRLFKISYDRFTANLYNIYGIRKKYPTGPYLYQADQARLDYLDEFYRSYNEYAKTLDDDNVSSLETSDSQVASDNENNNSVAKDSTRNNSLIILGSKRELTPANLAFFAKTPSELTPADLPLFGRSKPSKDLNPGDLPFVC